MGSQARRISHEEDRRSRRSRARVRDNHRGYRGHAGAGRQYQCQVAKNTRHLKIAYLSFAVANSYDAPMLAAAKQAASKGGATITVLDANNSPNTQFSQLQTAATSGQYEAIIVQPIFGTGLIPPVKQAISKGIKVVNMDQELGPNLSTSQAQVPGLSGNVVFVPTNIGTKLGNLVVKACAAKNLNPCNVGYLYDIKASALDVAIRNGFNKAIAGHPSIKVVSEGQSFFTPVQGGLAAVQTMVQAQLEHQRDRGLRPGDRGRRPGRRADEGDAGRLRRQRGRPEGRRSRQAGTARSCSSRPPRGRTQCRLRDQAPSRPARAAAAVDPVDALPSAGVVTKANVAKFKGEWPG